MAKAGERFNFESYFKDPRDGSEIRKKVAINPHDSFHYGRTDQCVNCHREHRLSTVTCEKCHDIDP
ncbi:MAG: cytochrome c3 family protein [Sutterella wadsworthensis]